MSLTRVSITGGDLIGVTGSIRRIVRIGIGEHVASYVRVSDEDSLRANHVFHIQRHALIVENHIRRLLGQRGRQDYLIRGNLNIIIYYISRFKIIKYKLYKV